MSKSVRTAAAQVPARGVQGALFEERPGLPCTEHDQLQLFPNEPVQSVGGSRSQGGGDSEKMYLRKGVPQTQNRRDETSEKQHCDHEGQRRRSWCSSFHSRYPHCSPWTGSFQTRWAFPEGTAIHGEVMLEMSESMEGRRSRESSNHYVLTVEPPAPHPPCTAGEDTGMKEST